MQKRQVRLEYLPEFCSDVCKRPEGVVGVFHQEVRSRLPAALHLTSVNRQLLTNSVEKLVPKR